MKFTKKLGLALLLLVVLLLGAGCGLLQEVMEATIPVSESAAPEAAEPVSPPELTSDGELTVHFIDVGQGDAVLILLPTGETMLIDGGDRGAAGKVSAYLTGQGVAQIDYLIGTHPHADHIGGLIQVLKDFPVGKIFMPKVVHNTKTYEELLETIQAQGLKITAAKSGLTLDLGAGLEALFVAPVQDEYDNLNNYSAVVKLTYGATAFLFTGDAEVLSELEILGEGRDLTSQVLKVGHHGSGTSTGQKFLTAVDSQIAVISVGADNSYGHPHREVVERLEWNGIEILRTDLLGDIIMAADGETIWQLAAPEVAASS